MLAALAIAATARAEVRTLRFDMPPNPGVFGIVWNNDYFEESLSGTIAEARLVVNFDTSGGVRPFHDAADILFQHQLPTTALPFWDVRGTDLGWSGTGRFTGTMTSHAFDGQMLIDEGDFVLWFGRIVSDNDSQQLLGGSLSNSYWEFDVNVVPGAGTAPAAMLGLAAAARRRRRI